jgi:purine-binding chemotaxis protein CheW
MSPDSEQAAAARAPAAEHHALLRRRAAALAREDLDPVAGRRSEEQIMVFRLGAERYGIAADSVLRVLVLRELTPLPGAAAPLFGVTHWRGRVLTLVDIRQLLGVEMAGVTDLGNVIVMNGADRDFGIVADAVSHVVDIGPAEIRELPDAGGDSGESLLRGITGEGIFIIDAERVLARFGRVRGRRHGTG